jgi:tRNA modification GTPase
MSGMLAGLGDTIFALASGAGRGAISLIRISGPGVRQILAEMVPGRPVVERRVCQRILQARDGAVLDNAVVLFMPGPGSYTGEDVAELHLHGGRAVLAAVTDALLGLGIRPAEAGEFTRRAFLNGRMDLLEAEGIADLIEAETEVQRRQALRQMTGELFARVSGWTLRVTRVLAFQEALIDFADESLPQDIEISLNEDIRSVAADMSAALEKGVAGERVRQGLVFAITGAPNVGKSSLLNRLARREVAIVSPSPGTTRDALEVPFVLGGMPVTLIDTAGLRETSDPVEAEGVRRARERAASADLVIYVVQTGDGILPTGVGLVVCNKVDLGEAPPGTIGVSALTGEGLENLTRLLEAEAARITSVGAHPVLTRARHRAAVQASRDALLVALRQDVAELRAEEFRLALQSLGRLTGAVDAESVLGEIFKAFCIGK